MLMRFIKSLRSAEDFLAKKRNGPPFRTHLDGDGELAPHLKMRCWLKQPTVLL
jgi:hypothetical protein